MKFQEFEEMRKKAILYDIYKRSDEIAESFRALVDAFNEYEERIGDSTKRMLWIDPKDKKVKRVKSVSDKYKSVLNILL